VSPQIRQAKLFIVLVAWVTIMGDWAELPLWKNLADYWIYDG
jgi:hypothetical protein